MKFKGNNGNDINATEDVGLDIAINQDSDSPGVVVGLGKVDNTSTSSRRAIQANAQGRLKGGGNFPLLADNFVGTTVNASVWKYWSQTTMTAAPISSSVVLNSGSITTINTNVTFGSIATYPILSRGGLSMEVTVGFSQLAQTNNACEWGMFYATGATTPTTGAYFRLDSAGNVIAVVNYNGSETTSTLGTFADIVGGRYAFKNYQIIFNDLYISFLIDGTSVYRYSRDTTSTTIQITQTLPVAFRIYNGGSAPATAQQMRIGSVNVSLLDYENDKPWANIMAGGGGMGYQVQTGGTAGQTANYANSANPTAAVPTNTTAALGTGLGGQFWETNSLALTTDGVISSYQVPQSTLGTSKNLYITGVSVKSFVQTVLAGGPFAEQWVLAFGHTAVSLATTESATAKAPRRMPLGTRTVGSAAAVNTELAEISRQFSVPLVVYPGEFVATVVKKVGTVGTSGTIAHVITFDCYWE